MSPSSCAASLAAAILDNPFLNWRRLLKRNPEGSKHAGGLLRKEAAKPHAEAAVSRALALTMRSKAQTSAMAQFWLCDTSPNRQRLKFLLSEEDYKDAAPDDVGRLHSTCASLSHF